LSTRLQSLVELYWWISGYRNADLTDEEIVAEVDKGMSTGLVINPGAPAPKVLGGQVALTRFPMEIGAHLRWSRSWASRQIKKLPGLYVVETAERVSFQIVRPAKLSREYLDDGCPAVESKREFAK
jgi:hypothetical protein